MYDISLVLTYINPEITGRCLKNAIFNAGYSVKDIQRYLKLSCPQPIYRWFRGKILPSLNHLYALSQLLNTHMECLLATSYFIDCCDFEHIDNKEQIIRLECFYRYIQKNTVSLI